MSYGIHIGRDHTADGHARLAGYGDEPSSHRLEIVDRPSMAPAPRSRSAWAPRPTCRDGAARSRRPPGPPGTCGVSYSYCLGVPAPITNGGLNEHGGLAISLP
jgi:hypothetical protein